MSNLSDEIIACDINCIKIVDGFPITDPPYNELTSGEQAIVDACIAAHDKPYGSDEILALAGLLTQYQKNAYQDVRDSPYWIARFVKCANGKAEAFQWLWVLDIKTKEQVQTVAQATFDSIPLWSEGGTGL